MPIRRVPSYFRAEKEVVADLKTSAMGSVRDVVIMQTNDQVYVNR